ncbi:MAG: rhomboid family intramembrane serine protease [Acidobacteria bacterium]|nr:rhomboid family intramembrane serine protease [Acidobacteriota bacterium]
MFPLRDSEQSQSRPYITMILIAINLLVFAYQLSLDGFSLNHFFETWGTVPGRLEPITLLTAMFLHGGWMHLLGNVWFLWVFGDNIEDILGRANFLTFYLLSGLGGGLAHVAFNSGSMIPAIGASGAISGVMGAYLMRFPKSRIQTLLFFFVFATTIEVQASLMIGYWFVVQLFSGFGQLASSSATGGGTAWFAHIGGFVAGLALIRILPQRPAWRIRQEYRW